MAEESNTRIAGNFQTFLTDQTEGKEDLNTDLPTGDNIRFIQFCRGMQVGLGMQCYKTIADQTDGIMVSNGRKGREESVASLIGMDRKEKTRFTFGPQWNDVDGDTKGKK